MGSGFFPLSGTYDSAGKKLKEALDLMKEAKKETEDYAAENDQFDNAAYDGAASERLSIAIEMVSQIIT